MTVRIDRRPQHQDDVVEDVGDLRIGGPREQIVGELQRVLRSGDFGRVQAAVDVDDRLAFAGQGQRPSLAQALRPRQLAGDLAIAIDLLQVRRRRDQREVELAALARGARLDQGHPIAGGVELPEVVDGLVVGGQLRFRAGCKAENGFRSGNAPLDWARGA